MSTKATTKAIITATDPITGTATATTLSPRQVAARKAWQTINARMSDPFYAEATAAVRSAAGLKVSAMLTDRRARFSV